MTPRLRRTIRTAIQVVLAVASVIPDFIAKVPVGASGVQVVAVATAVSHYFYLAEKVPGFPESLKVPDPTN